MTRTIIAAGGVISIVNLGDLVDCLTFLDQVEKLWHIGMVNNCGQKYQDSLGPDKAYLIVHFEENQDPNG